MCEESWQRMAGLVRCANAENGWDPPSFKELPKYCMMVVGELVEVEEETKPPVSHPRIAEELADVTIRLLDMLESIWPCVWVLRGGCSPSPFGAMPVLLWPILHPINRAVECWRMDHSPDACMCLEQALREVRYLAAALDIDLWHEVGAKLEKNETRGYLHGKVRQ